MRQARICKISSARKEDQPFEQRRISFEVEPGRTSGPINAQQICFNWLASALYQLKAAVCEHAFYS
jgi:hypothetical protein